MKDVQLKMARAALGLGVREAAELTGVSHFTIARIEAGDAVKPSTVAKIRTALEAAGVQFIPENGGGAGVRMARRDGQAEGSKAERAQKRAKSRDAAHSAMDKALDGSPASAGEKAERKRKLTEPLKGA